MRNDGFVFLHIRVDRVAALLRCLSANDIACVFKALAERELYDKDADQEGMSPQAHLAVVILSQDMDDYKAEDDPE